MAHVRHYDLGNLACFSDGQIKSHPKSSGVKSEMPTLEKSQIFKHVLSQVSIKAPKFSHTTPILRSLHWLKVTERIEYKLLSLTYKVLTTTQPSYLHNLITVQPPRSTRSSSLVTLARPPTSSSLRITDRSFQYPSPRRRRPEVVRELGRRRGDGCMLRRS